MPSYLCTVPEPETRGLPLVHIKIQRVPYTLRHVHQCHMLHLTCFQGQDYLYLPAANATTKSHASEPPWCTGSEGYSCYGKSIVNVRQALSVYYLFGIFFTLPRSRFASGLGIRDYRKPWVVFHRPGRHGRGCSSIGSNKPNLDMTLAGAEVLSPKKHTKPWYDPDFYWDVKPLQTKPWYDPDFCWGVKP